MTLERVKLFLCDSNFLLNSVFQLNLLLFISYTHFSWAFSATISKQVST